MYIVSCHKRDMCHKRDITMYHGTIVPLAPLKLEYFDSENCVRSTNIRAFQVCLHLLTQVKKSWPND